MERHDDASVRDASPDEMQTIGRSDVIAQLLAESDAAKRELHAMFEHISDAFLALDADWRCTCLNGRACAFFNREPEELLGKIVWTELPEYADQPLQSSCRTAVETGLPVFFETYDASRDRWFEYRVYPAPEGLTVFFRDVSDRRRVESALSRVTRALTVCARCNRALTHAESEQGLLDDICRICVGVGGYRMAWIGFAQADDDRTVLPVAVKGRDEGSSQQADVRWSETEQGHGLTGTAIRTGTPAIAQDIQNDPSYGAWKDAAIRHGYRSAIALPLILDGNVLGALSVYAAEPDAFDSAEVALLAELTSNLAYGLGVLRDRAEPPSTRPPTR